MKKTNLSNCTFIIPVRIDSNDRTRNLITVLCFLLRQFDTKIILKEVASQPLVDEYILPQVKEFLDNDLKGFTYLFEKSDNPEFHRMKIINEVLNQVETDVVVNYDSDVLLKPEIYEKSVNLISIINLFKRSLKSKLIEL